MSAIKVRGLFALLHLDPTIKFKNSRVFIQTINWSFIWAQTPYVSISYLVSFVAYLILKWIFKNWFPVILLQYFLPMFCLCWTDDQMFFLQSALGRGSWKWSIWPTILHLGFNTETEKEKIASALIIRFAPWIKAHFSEQCLAQGFS